MLNLSFKALKANRLKTSLIILSLVFSITSIFLITSISNGVISMYSSMLKSDGDIIITQKNISDTFFSNVDIKLLKKLKKLQQVKKASALIVGASIVEDLPIVAVYGVTKNRFNNYRLTKGIYPKNGEVLVGKSIFETLKNKKEVVISNKKFKISGVFKSKIGFENGGVVLNIKDASNIFNKSASMIMLNCKIDTNIDALVNKINKIDNNIQAKSTNNFVDNYNQFKIIKTSSNVISFISFCMGLLTIASILSITINQRKTEFGIKRAIGISMKKILLQIMSESIILAIASFIISICLANIALFFIKNISYLHGYVNGEISINISIFIFITSILIAVLGSIIPALNASKTDPIILIQGNKI
ncbi:ABC transporter permease [Arcobacter sp. CECT 8985]|uniref:ABC transporter permease n=1 Tax=Arcobacter sp. CECT 8985 TaxID=1935424 RepID=UPI00100A4C30|nr:ABC transporter permease [Arcobacter sp. CECT 8985]RXJ84592.1 ABC transporter permease [Arcobacter sp. CECT 8985]